jgi:O-succinylbenzoic acid--CoA ligase
VVADRSRGFRTTEFTNAADKLLRLSGRHYSSLVPTQLQRLLGDPAAVAAAAELDGILIGGAPLHDDLHARALDAGLTVICAYGLSETAGGCVYDGLPLSDVRLRIDDAGCLQVFGPLLARGYLGRPDLTATTFVDGGVRTKDIARLDGGVLTVLGRADDMIITGGVKVAPVAVEHVLRSCAGVEQVCVLGVPDTEWGARVIAVVVAGDPNRPPSIETLRNTVRAELGAAATPRQVVLTDSLPLRGAGKIDRTAVLNSLSPFT